MIKKLLWSGAFLMTGLSLNAQSVVEFLPERDNSIYSESENSNGEGKLFAGQNCSDNTRRALIEFDIASLIPAGATITDVTLTLALENTSPGAGTQDYGIHRVLTEWGEGTSFGTGEGGEAVAPDATWLDAMFETSEWDDAGGDFNPDASAISPISELIGTYTWSSPEMVNNVQDWLDYPGSNHGWILIGDEEVTCTARRFGSKDAGDAPILEVTYTCTDAAPVAKSQALTLYLDETGSITVSPEDFDNGSFDACDGTLTYSASPTTFDCEDIFDPEPMPSLIISGVYDGPLSGGTPKGVEIFVINDIEDLSVYGVGFANNGGGSDGIEFTFPAISAQRGDYLYVASEKTRFAQWFGFVPDFATGSASINGDDAIELFMDEEVIDIFGDVDVDGSGEDWEYLDGWAYRNSNTDLDGAVFNIDNWTFSGPNALDGEDRNATADTPFPLAQFKKDATVGIHIEMYVTDEDGLVDSCDTYVLVRDTLAPAMSCVGETTIVLDETGVVVLEPADLDAGTEDGCGIESLSLSMLTFTCENDGENAVMLYATDIYGNTDSCEVIVTIDASEVISISEVDVVDPTCFGFADGSISISADGGTPDYTYDWDNDGTGDADDFPILNTVGDGTYEIIVEDANGCTATAVFELEDPEEIMVSGIVTDESCPGAGDGSVELTITGGTEPYEVVDEVEELTSGDYTITVVDINGCSQTYSFTVVSAVEIDLTVTETAVDLTSNEDGASYQWLACPDFTVIDGATDQTYTPDAAGSYACEITTTEGCVDTTACFVFGVDGIDEINSINVSVYPNPSSGIVNVKLSGLNGSATLTVLDIKGSVVYQTVVNQTTEQIDLSKVDNGIYFIQLNSEEGMLTKKITVSK